MSQYEYFGFNSIKNLPQILSKHKPKRIMLVTGKSSYEKSGAKHCIEPFLSNFDVIHFYDFDLNPKIEDIEKGIKILKEKKCDFIIAVGGGSVIDIAKSVNIFSSNDIKPMHYFYNGTTIKSKGKPLVAIPTTAGTGSEITRFAVVYINRKKHTLDHKYIIPDYTIIDPQLILSLPKNIFASSGFDALAQAIESYWSIHSTRKSKIYAETAIKIILKNILEAVNRRSRKSVLAMAKAAHLSGKQLTFLKQLPVIRSHTP